MLKIAWAVLHPCRLSRPSTKRTVCEAAKQKASWKMRRVGWAWENKGKHWMRKMQRDVMKEKKNKKSPEIKLSFQNKRLNTTELQVPVPGCAVWHAIAAGFASNGFALELSLCSSGHFHMQTGVSHVEGEKVTMRKPKAKNCTWPAKNCCLLFGAKR